MSITILFMQMIKLFLIMCIGYTLYKINIIDDHTKAHVTKIILYVTTPALIVHSFIDNMTGEERKILIELFATAMALYIILPVIAVIIALILRIKKCERGMYIFMTVFANVGFMGFPVTEALFGSVGVFYAAVFNCVFNLFLYTLGVMLMYYGTDENNSFKDIINGKRILNPGVICCFVSVIIFAFNIPVPKVLDEVLASVGSLTSPLAMMLVGASLAVMNVKELFGGVRIYLFTALKQIGIPLLLWPLIRLFIQNDMLASVTLLMASMPVANTAVLFATEYKKDEKLAARGIFITTVVSLITIPFVVYICL